VYLGSPPSSFLAVLLFPAVAVVLHDRLFRVLLSLPSRILLLLLLLRLRLLLLLLPPRLLQLLQPA